MPDLGKASGTDVSGTDIPADASVHGQKVAGLFGNIAGVYDLLNRVFSLGIDALWRKKLAEACRPAMQGASGAAPVVILDLAAGTLEVTKELVVRYPDATILATDFCLPMLKVGQNKKPLRGARVLPVVGNALSLPLADSSVRAITVAFGLRNFKPRGMALKEAFRVLQPGGMVCVLEFGSARDKILFGLYNWYLARVLPLVGRLASRDKEAYQYLADTIQAFPSADELCREFEDAGFVQVGFTRYTGGIVCIHCGRKQ